MSDDSSKKTQATCKSCVFYAHPQAEGTPAELGSCRRYPRTIDVAHGHWCGEYRVPEPPSGARVVIERGPDGSLRARQES